MSWEAIFLALGAAALVVFLLPRLRASLQRSREMESNWQAVVLPLVAVVAFVLLLITIARG